MCIRDRHNPAQAFAGGTDDAFALSGTERFPKDYGAIKGFEKEIGQEKPDSESDPFAIAFDKLGKLDKRAPREESDSMALAEDVYKRQRLFLSGHRKSVRENLWQEW